MEQIDRIINLYMPLVVLVVLVVYLGYHAVKGNAND